MRHAIGVDISTQSVAAMLIGVAEKDGIPSELAVSGTWMTSNAYPDETARRSPQRWVELVRASIADLKKRARETEHAQAVGVSTTFPGVFPILNDGSIDPERVSLYDNTDDAGICAPEFEDLLARAEEDTLNRMWPGNMAVGLAHLIRSRGLRIEDAAAIVPPNSAFAWALLRAAGVTAAPGEIVSDFTETVIGGLYHSGKMEPVPRLVEALIHTALPELRPDHLRTRLPRALPSWRNVLTCRSAASVGKLLGLPNLTSVSVGAGDSPLGTLVFCPDADTILGVRGSTDSPMLLIDSPRPRNTRRETVLHYPMPTAASLADSPWCAVAPTLRSGKVWDWVRGLRFDACDADTDRRLEMLATEALKRRLTSPPGSLERAPLVFDTALGGERAPEWNPRARGKLDGLLESHGVGDIALAALEGMSVRLRRCLELMEQRYDASPSKLVLAGGPARNALWNWITQVFTGKRTFATTFSDASLLGAAILGYGASYCDTEDDCEISRRLQEVSRLASEHPLIRPEPVGPPDELLADMEQDYAAQAEAMLA